MYRITEACAGVAVGSWLNSNAHCCLAESIWRRLLMHASLWLTVRALTKLGTARVANNPMIATTIMISTRVKAPALVVLIFMNCYSHFPVQGFLKHSACHIAQTPFAAEKAQITAPPMPFLNLRPENSYSSDKANRGVTNR